MTVTVRPAQRDDVPAIVRLLADDLLGAQRERVEEPVAPTYIQAFDDMAAQPGNQLLVAVGDGQLIGCLQLTIVPGLSRAGMRRAHLEGVRVGGAHRGARVGEQLVLAAIARAREAGCGLVQLTSDVSRVDARRFYERLGFVASHVGMKLALSASRTEGSGAAAGHEPAGAPLQPGGRWRVHDLDRPCPPVVSAGPVASLPAPSDAVVLIGPGSNLSQWQSADGAAAPWTMIDGVIEAGGADIQTRDAFADVQLHVEFATPAVVTGGGQGRGNSGVFLAGVFEIQVLDSFDNPTYADGQAAALYGQHPPLVNASRPPGEWQSYNITFIAPRFTGMVLASPAVVTMLHNGVVVHHARPFWGPTAHQRIDPYVPATARGPVRLQYHRNPVRYRNIWVRPLAT